MLKALILFFRTNPIARSSLMIASISVVAKLLGYAEKVLVAYYWGTGAQADVYYAVTGILVGMALFFRELFEPALLNAITARSVAGGRSGGYAVYGVFFRFMAVVCVVVSGAMLLFPEVFTSVFLPGFATVRRTGALLFFRWGSLAFFCLSLLTVVNTYLLSRERFFVIAISDFLYKAVVVCVLALLTARYGIYAGLYAFLAGALVKFAFQTAVARDAAPAVTKTDHRIVWTILLLSVPLLVGNVFSQIGSIVQNVFASYMEEGALSALTYAKKLIDLPVVLIPYTLSMVAFPYFSRLSVEKNLRRSGEVLRGCLKCVALLFLPAMLFIALVPQQITSLVFEHGAFDSAAAVRTAQALSVYNAGLLAFAAETILVVYLLAQNRIRIAVLAGIAGVLTDIAVTWLLIDTTGFLGIAWGFVAGRWLKVVLLCLIVRRELFPATAVRSGSWLRILLAIGICAGAGLCYRIWLCPYLDGFLSSALALLCLAGLFYLVFYALLLKDVLKSQLDTAFHED